MLNSITYDNLLCVHNYVKFSSVYFLLQIFFFLIDKIFNTIVITRRVIRIKKNIGSIHNEVNEIKISIH